MRLKFTKNIKGISSGIFLVLLLPILYVTASKTMPYLQPIIEKAAVYSAAISFNSGSNAKYEAEDDISEISFIEDDQIDYSETEETIVYEEPPPESMAEASTPATSKIDTKEEKPKNAGTIERKTYIAGNTGVYLNLNEGYIKNCTKLSADKILAAVAKAPKFKIAANKKPEVLIMHTHATESYQAFESDYYDKAYTSRTTDNSKNTTRVGDEIEKQLLEAGIGVIHDRTLHDYPSYNGAYERSAATVKRILKENPTIKVVLDVHRDAIQPSADSMIAPVTEINGKKSAQVMIISGCDDGTMNLPNYMENLKFSAALQRNMEADYKTLARPIMFDYRKYNQNLTTGSILLEMGGHANTLDEAIYCGELVGKSLVKTLLALK